MTSFMLQGLNQTYSIALTKFSLFSINDNCISLSLDAMLYGCAHSVNGLYIFLMTSFILLLWWIFMMMV